MNAANQQVARNPTPDGSDTCPNCNSPADWSAASWCPACGYYPAANGLVAVPEVECDVEVYENWWQAVPRWLWVLSAGMVLLFFVSIGVRVVFAESPVRLWWTLGQMAIGFVAFSVAHLMAYLYGAARTDRVGPLDALIKPIATWHPVLVSLPRTVKMVCTGTWSLTAVILAFFVIDGIDFGALAEAKQQAAVEQRRKKTSPMAFVIRSAQLMAKSQGQSPALQSQPQSLEDALAEFTGETGVMGGDGGLLAGLEDGRRGGIAGSVSDIAGGNAIDPHALIEQHKQFAMGQDADGCTEGEGCPGDARFTEGQLKASRSPASGQGPASASSSHPGRGGSARTSTVDRDESIECVVFGYTTNIQGDPRSLLLAAPEGERLRFVAKVSIDDVAPDIREQMMDRFLSLHQGWPVVRSPFGGRWLRPELFCQVEFSGWTIGRRLNDPYVAQLAVLSTPPPADPKSSTAVQ